MKPVLLALTTLDDHSHRHLEKAARLAVSNGMRLRLAYCGEDRLKFDSPIARLENRARHLSRQFGQPVQAVDSDVRSRAALRHHAVDSALICLAQPERGAMPWWPRRDWLSLAMSLRTVPILVMHGDGRPSYRKVLVPVSLRADAAALARCSAAAALAPHARMDILHAAPLPELLSKENSDAHDSVLEHFLRKARIDTAQKLTALTHGLQAAGRAAHHALVLGPVHERIVAHQQSRLHDLVVVGATPRGPGWPLFRSTLAVALVNAVRADVLIVPEPFLIDAPRCMPAWRHAT